MSMPVAPTSSQTGWFFALAPVPNWTNPFVINTSQHVNTPTSAALTSQAYIATPDTIGNNAWYPDSGATHHLTNSATSLIERTPYNGPGKVYMRNGTALIVMATGQSSLLTCSRLLLMRSLLLVPGITKNLLSVSNFAKENQVMLEFFPQQCQVRDLQTREVLLRGSMHDSLYRLSLLGLPKSALSPDPTQCFTATAAVPLSIWHSRLSHPCKATLTTALHHYNIPFDTNKDPLNCIACHLGKEHKLPFSKSLFEYVKPFQLVVADV
ncbi:hypothetical protein PVK06_011613 [Gossypium arboreum]|uniref:GAG-pre-integrase domain-containing protein n=1 Tax=Gossypium arboreum TaxID=29729 RepID=A0ABR0Q979_GOSAR|nr:hypothetical protein PVK06_011613 [Gossypium arboreum]